jgi:GAF domain-containing protein/anti-sigma regulatory factor (Ser/Thr protein kinase)
MPARRNARRSPPRTPARTRRPATPLRRQLAEALERERALADILQVINASPASPEPVFEAILEHALRLCASPVGMLFLYDGEVFRMVAERGAPPAFAEPRRHGFRVGPHTGLGRAVAERQPVQISDVLADRAYAEADPARLQTVELLRARTVVWVPLLREMAPVGVICVWRREVQTYTPEQVGLLAAFASQAVIALENTRLFQALDARNHELARALERETATGGILRAIAGSPTDLQPVLDTVAENAARVCGAHDALIFRRDGDVVRLVAHHGSIVHLGEEMPLDRSRPSGRAVLERRTIRVDDLATEAESEFPGTIALQQASGTRALVATPLLREGVALGAITIRRTEVDPFTDDQVQILETFAAEAVIAIENVRLFQELQARNRELTEALEQQTATSEVLGVISSSPTDPDPVYRTILANVTRLCEANIAALFLYDGELLAAAAHHNATPDFARQLDQARIPPSRDTPTRRAALERRIVHVADVLADPDYVPSLAHRVENPRTVLSVPMLREGELVGVITTWRREVRPFSDQQVALVKTFADQALIAIENVRLFQELQARNRDLTESLEQQTATAEILRVISGSPTDVQPVFDVIARNAGRLCGALFTAVFRFDGELIHLVAHHNVSPAGLASFRSVYPRPPGLDTLGGRAILQRAIVQVQDAQRDPDVPGPARAMAGAAGYRSAILVPLLKEREPLGVIAVSRSDDTPFSPSEVALLQTFAAQAVIAIDNVRLFQELQARNAELTKALDRETATSEVLRVISASPTDVEPVFEAILRSAVQLCGGVFGAMYRFDGQLVHLAGSYNIPPDLMAPYRGMFPAPPHRGLLAMRAILDRSVAHVPDVEADPDFRNREQARALGMRSIVAVPLLQKGTTVGAIAVGRGVPEPFRDDMVTVLQTFADQAVIAIENVRLFRELEARNRELTESLEQQTATGEILAVISSSPMDLQPVFDVIVESAVRLCEGLFAVVLRFDGELVHFAADHGFTAEAREVVRRAYPLVPMPDNPSSRAILDRSVVNVTDILAEPGYRPVGQHVLGYRSILCVPMLREGVPIGVIVVTRTEVKPFSDREIGLLQTFASQAVIAIENGRLFQELQARNRELTESLEQQTATSEVLKVISRSTFDLEPVLETLIENATRLCGAQRGVMYRWDGEVFRVMAAYNSPAELTAFLERSPHRPGRGSAVGRVALDRQVVHIADVTADPEYHHAAAQIAGLRAVLAVPMFREGALIGAMGIWSDDVRVFTPKQIELVTTFADQAVIAIENVRLLTELRARTEQLARSVQELRALGEVGQAVSSTLDLDTVLTTVVARAVELSATDGGAIYEFDEAGQEFLLRATHGMGAEIVGAVRELRIRAGETAVGRAAAARRPMQVPEIREEPAYPLREVALKAGFRAFLVVPLVREEQVVGALVVRRRAPGEFPEATVDLLQSFAAQSVLAIQNARLFRELEEKSRQLEVASRHKSQFLANMSHELRTPLNAILGYTELILDSIYGEIPGRAREVMERIDKSGRHLLGLINDVLDLSKIEAGQLTLALVDFSLRDIVQTVATAVEALAAEKQLALKVVVAPDLPRGRGDERRLAQVLLNLVGNAIKFTEAGEVRVEATAADGRFVVSVSDTGPGIAAADQQRIFEEFQQADTSSTRKKGGTGLGLSIARRIVEMHGGRLWVESEPGRGSTFRFTVPVRA